MAKGLHPAHGNEASHGMGPDEGRAVRDEKVKRGQTLRAETGRDRSDDMMGYGDTLHHDPEGSNDDITHSIRNGKVPEDE